MSIVHQFLGNLVLVLFRRENKIPQELKCLNYLIAGKGLVKNWEKIERDKLVKSRNA